MEKKDEEQRVGIEVLLYEASLGGRLESYRLRLRVVGMFALSFFVFASFSKFGPKFLGWKQKRRRRVAGEETWSDERREKGRRLVRQTVQLGRREGGHGPMSQI